MLASGGLCCVHVHVIFLFKEDEKSQLCNINHSHTVSLFYLSFTLFYPSLFPSLSLLLAKFHTTCPWQSRFTDYHPLNASHACRRKPHSDTHSLSQACSVLGFWWEKWTMAQGVQPSDQRACWCHVYLICFDLWLDSGWHCQKATKYESKMFNEKCWVWHQNICFVCWVFFLPEFVSVSYPLCLVSTATRD